MGIYAWVVYTLISLLLVDKGLLCLSFKQHIYTSALDKILSHWVF